MFRRSTLLPGLGMCTVVLLTGCMPKMTIEQMKAEMPKRPAELDKLNAFVGKWESEGEVTMAMLDEPMKTSGTNEANWDGDGWFLVNRGTFNMGEFDPMIGFETIGYDERAKKFRSSWFDSMGSIGTGTFWHDEKTDTWQWRAKSRTSFGKSNLKGHVKFSDDDTMEWTMTEYMGFMKTMEMTGTSRRK